MYLEDLETWQLSLILLAIIWELVWKGIAMWRAAHNGHKGWFVAMLIINSVGLLPLIYLSYVKPATKK